MSNSSSCCHEESIIFIGNSYKEEEGGELADHDQESSIHVLECRICQEEEDRLNLEVPCKCAGTLKYAHRKCLQRWCNEKGNTICEICAQQYQSGYTAIPLHEREDRDTAIHIRDVHHEYGRGGGRLFDSDEEEDIFEMNSTSAAASCRSAAIMLMALMLLRQALAVTAPNADDDASLYCIIVLTRAAGFLLPCYLMARALYIIQLRWRHHYDQLNRFGMTSRMERNIYIPSLRMFRRFLER